MYVRARHKNECTPCVHVCNNVYERVSLSERDGEEENEKKEEKRIKILNMISERQ